jgi:hypothetical protein
MEGSFWGLGWLVLPKAEVVIFPGDPLSCSSAGVFALLSGAV